MAGSTSQVMHIFVVILIAGNVLALAAGLALMLMPQQVVGWFGLRSAHPTSVRRLTKSLEVPRNSDKVLLHYPRVLGLTLLAGGVYVLIRGSMFVSGLSVADGAAMLARLFPRSAIGSAGWETLWIAALLLILLGAVVAIVVGVLALVRMQTLKNLLQLSGRWVSTRQAAKPASRPYYGIDRFVATNPQVWGGIITVLAAYTLGMILWFSRGGAF